MSQSDPFPPRVTCKYRSDGRFKLIITCSVLEKREYLMRYGRSKGNPNPTLGRTSPELACARDMNLKNSQSIRHRTPSTRYHIRAPTDILLSFNRTTKHTRNHVSPPRRKPQQSPSTAHQLHLKAPPATLDRTDLAVRAAGHAH